MAEPPIPPLLLPAPHRMSLLDGPAFEPPPDLAAQVAAAIADPKPTSLLIPQVRFGSNWEWPGGLYRLTVMYGGITIMSRDSDADTATVRHALLTLAQLFRQYPHAVPALILEDIPKFSTRGVMLDVSRNKIPTTASLLSTIDALAALKFNHLQLYTEHTFAYAGHEEAWQDVDPITPDEVRTLDAACAARGIDLCPNQNCFGHLSSWLKLPKYAHLAETHGPWKFLEWDRSGPFSLCPIDDRSEAFVRDLLSQLLPCFRSGLVNIGCDETFDVGFGRSAAEVDKRGRAAVYFEFVNKVAAIARSLGKRPMMWADIALHDPDSLSMFPQGAVGLAWGYEPDADFAGWCNRLRMRRIEAWVCPGTSSWRSITGRTTERNANLAAAAVQGRQESSRGYLVTDWGDSGHHQHWPIALNAIARAAQAACNPDGLATFDPRAVSLHVFNDRNWASPESSIAVWLDRLGDVDHDLRVANALRNNSFLFMDLHRGYGSRPLTATPDQLCDLVGRLDALEATAPSPNDVGQLVADELTHTLLTARLAIQHAIAMRKPNGPDADDVMELFSLTRAVLAEHRRLWPMRNRPGELPLSCAHYEKILARLGSPS